MTEEFRPEYKKKSIRSFVIRAGRMTDGQKRAFETYWPQYGASLFEGPLNTEQSFGREAPLVLEIGFGMGASLLEMAQNEPDKDFIGIEVHPPGVGRLIQTAGLAEVKNLKVYMADATDVMDDCIADNSLARVQIYFPDPWHKKKHNKRRIVQPEFVQKIRQKLAVGGVLHLATDWENYAEHMQEVMEAADGYANTESAGGFSGRPDYRPITKFEVRGEKLGHGVWDLIYQRTV
ncbi:tRNA (guanosine(46)-N7)-methyltransferase TrmB [Gilvimarinus agarilyticus]|uniref:tRNA (guanosine(46)-N7)-methyltransferase TrmB n=1 Tax=Gilvimarinus sp. 2_MG-2023 TaxID=3062666 RepID=UPI001C08F437|nr:tRNA (guanosine(46)-N7)-methyltransferase TrmB [Gilvimarinus sp. 2_MG-2023]MBU2884413.1 tRNA (guanosine(46)-N7)-methyltransferase TrmB [Gilvimarinus agarilyticus]MDO6569549.1 tRNA (guanosine(46)-N7)-methyltransferase TrmB [Gilvimarinus sp. 2_MG-2023]